MNGKGKTLRRLIVLFYFTLIFCQVALAAPPGEEAIYQLETESGDILIEGFPIWKSSGDLYVPFLLLLQATGTPFEQKSATRLTYQTLYQKEARELYLQNCPSSNSVGCERAFVMDGQIYVHLSTVEDLIGQAPQNDSRQQKLILPTANPELDTTSSFEKKQDADYRLQLEKFEKDRHIFSSPTFSVSNNTEFTEDRSDNLLFLQSSSQFLSHDLETEISTSQQQSDVRLRWGRLNSWGEYRFFTNQSVDFPEVLRPTLFQGLYFTSAPTGEDFIISERTISGSTQPGWRVILLINGLYFQEVISDRQGTFLFSDVPIPQTGASYKLRFEGPLGQVEERTQVVTTGNRQVPVGTTKYRLLGGEQNYLQGQVDYGLNASTSLGLDYLKKEKDQFVSPSVFWSWGPGVLGVSPIFRNQRENETSLAIPTEDSGPGQALRINHSLRWRSLSLFSENVQYQNFQSFEVNRPEDQIKLDEKWEHRAFLPFQIIYPFFLDLRWLRLSNEDVETEKSMTARLSTSIRKFYILNEVGQEETFGQRNSSSMNEINYFAGLDSYRLSNSFQNGRHEQVELEAFRTAFSSRYGWGVLGRYTSITDENLYALRFLRKWTDWSGELRLETGTREPYRVNFLFSTFVETRLFDTPFVSSEGSASAGHLKVVAFIDSNQNGTKEPEESVVPGLQIQDAISFQEFTTDHRGEIRIHFLRSYEVRNYNIKAESLQNAYLTPVHKTFEVMTFPGDQQTLHIPVRAAGDIFGIIQNRFWKKVVPVRLTDEIQNETHQSTRVDGRYKFEDLEPGLYKIEVDPEFLKEHQLASYPESVMTLIQSNGGALVAPEILLCPRSMKKELCQKSP